MAHETRECECRVSACRHQKYLRQRQVREVACLYAICGFVVGFSLGALVYAFIGGQ